ncbi:MAG: restriction endonuclease subunit S [Anaerolineales bacterium]|nr:restriction endonuclease subunit S [Anaerolineales bacterium]
MEVKKGYKQTEVGAVPKDWDVKPLGQLVSSVEYGSSTKSDTQGQIPVLRMGNLQSGKIDWTDLVYTSNEREISKYQLHSGDVLFNRTNTIDLVGKTSIYNGERPAIFAGYLIRINTDKSLLNPQFLNYILNAEFSKKYSSKVLSVAVGQANINGQKLKTYPIPLPPTKSEQDAIAAALSDMDALLNSLDALIAKKRLVKQGIMQELLTGKKRLPRYGGKWKVKTLGEIGYKFLNGGTPSTQREEYWNGSIPWITGADVIDQKVVNIRRFITEEAVKNSATNIVEKGHLLIVTRTGVGKIAITPFDVAISQDLTGVYIKKEYASPEFLFWYFDYNSSKLKNLNQGTSIAGITRNTLVSISLMLPSHSEQTAIAEILNDMDAEIVTLEARREKTSLLKQGMMQELLTGKTRMV